MRRQEPAANELARWPGAAVRAAAAVALACGLGAAFVGCAHVGEPRAFALYPEPDRPRARAAVAQLQGPVGTVDGIDVERFGTVFDLLPGCHVVGLRDKVGQSDVSGAWIGDVGPRAYAFRMRAGHLYVIDVSVRFRGAPHGTMTITAAERDGDGRVVQEVPPIAYQDEVDACRAWEAALHARVTPER